MPWPNFDHLWKHESYQRPLLSDRISDLISSRKPRTRGKYISLMFHLKGLASPFNSQKYPEEPVSGTCLLAANGPATVALAAADPCWGGVQASHRPTLPCHHPYEKVFKML